MKSQDKIHPNVQRVLNSYKLSISIREKVYMVQYVLNGKKKFLQRDNPRTAIRDAIGKLPKREFYFSLLNNLDALQLDRRGKLNFNRAFIVDNHILHESPSSQKKGTLLEAYDYLCQIRWNPENQKDSKKAMANGKYCLDYFGWSTPPSEVTSRKITEFMLLMKSRGLKGGTINRRLSALRLILKHAVYLDFIEAVPLTPWLKDSKPRERVLSKKEEAMVLNYFHHQGKRKYAWVVILAIETGGRIGEILGLTWNDVSDDFKAVTFKHTKNGESRRVPLLKRSRKILKKAKKMSENSCDRVFSVTQDGLSWHWKIMKQDLGFENEKEFVPHMLRHTCATRLAENDIPIQKMMLWLGHKSAAMSMRYNHLNNNTLFDVVKKIEGKENNSEEGL